MRAPIPELSYVVPVKDGAPVLEATLHQVWGWLDRRGVPAELLVVDDGSTDQTPDILASFAAAVTPHERLQLRTVRNPNNRGKGYSLRRAFLLARGELVLFTDADLTYSVDNADQLVRALINGADIAIGSRMHVDSRYVVAPAFFGKLFSRHLSGRVFNLLVRLLVVRGVRDTQAGLKAFRRPIAVQIAERVRLDRFSFDVEALFVARRRKMRIVECPVLFVYRKEPSTVRFVRDSIAMAIDMLRIRWRGMTGVYERPVDRAAIELLRRVSADPGGCELDIIPAARRRGVDRTG